MTPLSDIPEEDDSADHPDTLRTPLANITAPPSLETGHDGGKGITAPKGRNGKRCRQSDLEDNAGHTEGPSQVKRGKKTQRRK